VLAVAQVAAVVAAVIHVLFFVLESVLFRRPAVWRRFGIGSQRDADTVGPMALNQGFYNLFLALGGLAGAIAIGLGQETVGRTLVAFATACMLGAGLVLVITGGRAFLRAAAVQAVPPLAALVALAFTG
jgi:putative membrane protein